MHKNKLQLEVLLTIKELESKQTKEWKEIQDELTITIENLKPHNIIKNILSTLVNSSDLKHSLLNNFVGLATGYLSKLIVTGNSTNPVRKMTGSILQLLISNGVSRHPEIVIALANKFSSLVKSKTPPTSTD
jgi:hypothetical protein